MKKTRNMIRLLLLVAGFAATGLTIDVSHAGTNFIDFNSDPNSQLTVLHRSGALGGQWYLTDGAPSDPDGTNGYFSITDGSGSQRCTVLFNDIDAGLVVKAFTFAMDVRV